MVESAAVPKPAQKEKVVLHGVSLEQVAGVRAALAEKVPLNDVLTQESIEAPAWTDAERAWREAIAESPEHQIELMQKTRIAEDCLGRSVAPLEEDASAWVGVLNAVGTSDAPDTVLQKLGITMNDLGRLGRHWKRKAEADANLSKQLTERAPKATAPERLT